MRGDPDKLNAEYAEQSRRAREQHRESDGWEQDARAADAREEAKRDAMAEAESARMDAAVAEDDAERNERELMADVQEIVRLEFWVSDAERIAFKTGLSVGRKDERNRIATALSAAEQETAALWQEGTPATKAVAAYTARVRAIVEGRT